MTKNQLFLYRIKSLGRISIIKSLYINLRLLPFAQAIKFPVLVSKSTKIESLSGKMILINPAKFGVVRIGFFNSDFLSWREHRNYLNIKGTVIFGDQVQFGVGTKLVVDNGARFEVGDNAAIGSNSRIICREKIVIGNNFRAAWDSQILDTNFHYTKDITTGMVSKRTKPIIIGNNNWIGNRSSIMQGTKTPDFFIAASNTLCNKDYTTIIPKYSLVGGSPAKLLKTGLYRVLDREEKEINLLFKNTLDDFVITDKIVRAR